MPQKDLAKELSSAVRSGLSIERMDIEEVRKLPLAINCTATGHKHGSKRHKDALGAMVNDERKPREQLEFDFDKDN
jgi:hypothetical protein